MQFPESWLRQWCNPSMDTAQLADALTMAGIEVEDIAPAAMPCGVVVARIDSASVLPGQDRLRVCQVDAGTGRPCTVVCGAPNARPGIKVPLATLGATLTTAAATDPLVVRTQRFGDVASEGMLCSAHELGLGSDNAGLLELPDDAQLGVDVRTILHMDDALLTIKLTPNLAHCLSVHGVARELSALTQAPLTPRVFPEVAPTIPDILPLTVTAADLCGRFCGRIVRNVDARAPTPWWMRERLRRCGQRSISALVDISNYVMLESGQPSHVFDLDTLRDGLEVRWGRSGEVASLLHGATAAIDPHIGVIADSAGIQALAGIMGGSHSAVGDDTRNIYIEAAFWHPAAIAGRARALRLTSEAAHRFERGVDPSLTRAHLERITQLILDICGTPQTTVGPIDDHRVAMPVETTVSMRVARASKILGVALSPQQCLTALRSLGLEPTPYEDRIDVQVPPHRFDLRIEEDLVEEIARVIGYDTLPMTPPLAPAVGTLRPENTRSANTVRHAMAALGYQEVLQFSFCPEQWERDFAGNTNPVRLHNPIASDLSVLRSTLLGSLVDVQQRNQARKIQRVRVFEIGRVFAYDPTVGDTLQTVAGFAQPMRLAALACGPVDPLQWASPQRAVDFYDVKGDLESLLATTLSSKLECIAAEHPAMHPGRCARLRCDGVDVGVVGVLHPQWCQAYGLTQTPVLFEIDLDLVLRRAVPRFVPVPRLHPVERDVAVWVDESITAQALFATVHAAPCTIPLRDAVLFDVYRALSSPSTTPAHAAPAATCRQKSMGIRLTFTPDRVAISDADIEAAVATILSHLERELGAHLRT
ncbi:phenylalanine--tRNA ligase subunit beta [Candidatus Symbiobacter mobilis]|uniref:Phenylalanine--tRNA ligase beta subunit n=1 Tax=Candidatus Symbiobacter mobilis CR TaxID=946483 RepID=U5N7R6_9BURK|nr:phenylalanine--tRNA ligase subunit beta [Candidatus Symbiobacter mobilis]AGX86249.1 phenylalanyl-tRNA synthetase subunuit beta [Candidatus Symbiobacter mobilis CR]